MSGLLIEGLIKGAISSLQKINVVLYAVQNDGVYLTGMKLQSGAVCKRCGSFDVEVNR